MHTQIRHLEQSFKEQEQEQEKVIVILWESSTTLGSFKTFSLEVVKYGAQNEHKNALLRCETCADWKHTMHWK